MNVRMHYNAMHIIGIKIEEVIFTLVLSLASEAR